MQINAISDILRPPKAKVTRSNRVGCASKINRLDLLDTVRVDVG
jgi:hypothetical protein